MRVKDCRGRAKTVIGLARRVDILLHWLWRKETDVRRKAALVWSGT